MRGQTVRGYAPASSRCHALQCLRQLQHQRRARPHVQLARHLFERACVIHHTLIAGAHSMVDVFFKPPVVEAIFRMQHPPRQHLLGLFCVGIGHEVLSAHLVCVGQEEIAAGEELPTPRASRAARPAVA
jgi:hypothetical protein